MIQPQRPLTIAGMALLLVFAGGAGHWNAIDSLSGKDPVRVKVAKKTRNYFRVTPTAALALDVHGPCRLRIVSRAEVPPGSDKPASYQLRVEEGGRVLKEQTTESSRSSKAKLVHGDTLVCKARNLYADIPSGPHRLTLVVTGDVNVLVRLMTGKSTKNEEPMISLTPTETPRTVTLSSGEELTPYYSVFADKQVRFNVTGPVRVQLTTRLDFDSTMQGVQAYTLKISDNGKLLRQANFRAGKATAAGYTDLRDRVPSKFDRLELNLEGGHHELSIELVSPKNGSAEVHARIPQPAVGDKKP